jgi:hypothetical protein
MALNLPSLTEFQNLNQAKLGFGDVIKSGTEGYLKGHELAAQIAQRKLADEQRRASFAESVRSHLAGEQVRNDTLAEKKIQTTKSLSTADVLGSLGVDPDQSKYFKNLYGDKMSPLEQKEAQQTVAAQQKNEALGVFGSARETMAQNGITRLIDGDKQVQNSLDLLNRAKRLQVNLAHRDFTNVSPEEKQEIVNGIARISLGGYPTEQTLKKLGFPTIQAAKAAVTQFFNGDPQALSNPNIIALLHGHLNREEAAVRDSYHKRTNALIERNRTQLNKYPGMESNIRRGVQTDLDSFSYENVSNIAAGAASDTQTQLGTQPNVSLENPVLKSITGQDTTKGSKVDIRKKWGLK